MPPIIFLIFLLSNAAADDAKIMANLAGALSPTPHGWSSSPSSNPCKWLGVTCDFSNRVSAINLPSQSLSGKLPSNLNELSNLKSIALQKNTLSGPFPSFANLTALQEIFLDTNSFSSAPPSFLTGLTALKTLSISNNPNLSPWEIPTEISLSSSLITLSMGKTNLFGKIPDFLGSLPNLQDLRLSYNNLTGPLPASFSESGLRILLLNNQKTGISSRLDVLATMPKLAQVWLHENSFFGPLPDLSNCNSLFDLQLRDNQITGVVPLSLTSLPKLVNVSLQNNWLQGPIPVFRKGIEIILDKTNNFCNSSPGPCEPQVTILLEVAEALGYPITLADSWSGNNACNKWVFVDCDEDGNNISAINFGWQGWSGTISDAFRNLTSLKKLLLNNNALSGSIPETLISLPQLLVLDVSNNNLSGKIPKFPSRVTLKTSGNPLLGTELASGGGNDSQNLSTRTHRGRLYFFKYISIAAAGAVVLVALGFIILYSKKRKLLRVNASQSPKGTEENLKEDAIGNVYGHGRIMNEEASNASNEKVDHHIQVCDGGNVTLTTKLLRDSTDNFSKANILGKGGFGVVYKGKLNDGSLLAVKRMESNSLGSKGIYEFEAEINVLTKVRHKHLVALLGYCINKNERLLVYEYMPQGTLAQHLFEWEESEFCHLTWKQRIAIALDVAKGVEYLHSFAQQCFIHRDLKPSNILLGDDMRAKVSDFGLVKCPPDGKQSLETRLAGTFGYLAPEYASTGRVSTKVDVFSFGVVLMELLTGQKALDEKKPDEKSHLVGWFRKAIVAKEGIRESIDPSIDDIEDEETFEGILKVAELSGHCTAPESYQRPDMGHVVNVLAPLVKQWKPINSGDEFEENIVIDLQMTLPQALDRWQAIEENDYTK